MAHMRLLTTRAVIFASSLFLGLGSETAWSEYNAGKLGEAAGAYLNAVDMVLQLQQSRCGYVFKKKSYSIEGTVKELRQHLRPKDQEELQAFLDGDEFRRVRLDNAHTIEDWLQSLAREGYDEKTICGMIASNVANVLNYAIQKWEYAKQHYAK